MAIETRIPTIGAGDAAERREEDRLDEELAEDVPAPGAEGLAQADLARPLGDRDQHDVHDPDPADQQADAADRREQDGERRSRRGGRGQEVLLGLDGEVGLGRVADRGGSRGGPGSPRIGRWPSTPWLVALIAIVLTLVRPKIRWAAVVTGTTTWSSWLKKPPAVPLAANTPTTWRRTVRTGALRARGEIEVDVLADRLAAVEQVGRGGRSDHRDRRSRTRRRSAVKKAPSATVQLRTVDVVRRRAGDRCVRVGPADDHLGSSRSTPARSPRRRERRRSPGGR